MQGALWRSAPVWPVAPRLALPVVAAAWLAPLLPGLAGLALWSVTGGALGLPFRAVSTALALAPLASLPGWVLALPLVALLLRAGRFGWLPAALAGLAAGTAAGHFIAPEVAPPYGVASIVLLRALAGRALPLAPG